MPICSSGKRHMLSSMKHITGFSLPIHLYWNSMIPALPAASFFLMSLALGPNFGYFNGDVGPIILITAAFMLLILDIISKLYHWNIVSLEHSHVPAFFLCVITFAAYLFYMWGQWIRNAQYFNNISYLSYFLLFVICYLLYIKGERLQKIIFFIIIGTAFLIRILLLFASPSPALDVFVILKEAPVKLLAGINPYTTLYTYVFPGITPNYYAYWPAAILLQLPFIQLFHDPRVLLILADVSAAFLLYLISGKSKTGIFLSLTYLFRPQSLYILEGSWLTPLNFFLVTLLIYILKQRRAGDPKEGIPTGASPGLIEDRSVNRKNLALEARLGIPACRQARPEEQDQFFINITLGIILGILTSIQFFHAVIFFFLAKYLHWSKKFIISFVVTVSIFVLPFLFLSPAQFINQTLLVYFKNTPHPSILIHTSLSLNTLFWTITKTDVPSFIVYLLILGIFFFLCMKQKQKLSAILANITLFFLAVFLFGRQAFVNYYYFVASLLLLYLTVVFTSDGGKENKLK